MQDPIYGSPQQQSPHQEANQHHIREEGAKVQHLGEKGTSITRPVHNSSAPHWCSDSPYPPLHSPLQGHCVREKEGEPMLLFAPLSLH